MDNEKLQERLGRNNWFSTEVKRLKKAFTRHLIFCEKSANSFGFDSVAILSLTALTGFADYYL